MKKYLLLLLLLIPILSGCSSKQPQEIPVNQNINIDQQDNLGATAPNLLKIQNGVINPLSESWEFGKSSRRILGVTATTVDAVVFNAATISATTANITTANITTLSVSTASTQLGHTNLAANSNTTSTLSVIQSGTGDIVSLYDGGAEVFSVIDGGTVVLKSKDTIKNTSASTTAISGAFSITGALSATVISASANFLSNAGTVSLPSHTFTSDPDTGWYSRGANQVGLSVGGSDLFRGSSTMMVFPLTGTLMGIGTTTPIAKLSISTISQQAPTYKLLDIASTTNKTLLGLSASGILSMGAGSAAPINVFQVNTASSTLDVLAGLNIGQLTAPANAGQITFYNHPVNSSSPDETVHGGVIQLDNNNLLAWRGFSDGAGSVDKLGVGIGTTSPGALFSVESMAINRVTERLRGKAGQTSDLLQIASSTNLNFFVIDAQGMVGVGTSTPKSKLSVSTQTAKAPTYKMFTVASTTGATLFEVLANGTTTVTGNLRVTGKIFATGGVDPAYVSFNNQTRASIIDMVIKDGVKDEVLVFYNSEVRQMEVYDIKNNEFKPFGLLSPQTPATGQKQSPMGWILGSIAILISLISLRQKYV